MINQIKNEHKLIPYLATVIEDAGISVGVDARLTVQDYIGIKVDDYYNGLKTGNPPKSVDFIVSVDCSCNTYSLYIIELKNVKNPGGIIIKDIQDKFNTAINDFMSARFKNIFLNDCYKFNHIHLYLISDVYHASGKFSNHEAYAKFIKKIEGRDTLKVEQNLSSKLFKFKGKILRIQYDIPPNPIIKKIT